MAYFTKQEAREAARESVRKSYTASNSSQRITEGLESHSSPEKFDIFLSHSIDDADLVLGIKELLEKKGLKVYVDWDTDRHLSRNQVNKETAELLRARMQQSNSLIYLATDNSSSSKWMPWELGYFDGLRAGGVAILPLMDREYQAFNGQEYLSLYPQVIKNQYTNGVEDIFVENKTVSWKNINSFVNTNSSWNNYS